MRVVLVLVISAVTGFAGCGGDDSAGRPQGDGRDAQTQSARQAADANKRTRAAKAGDAKGAARPGPTITLDASEFGSMLYDETGQAIYIFERDREGTSVCYGDCEEAWPPVFTEGEPRAADGVRKSLLGTVRRRGGKLQVTYAGKPLYFYAHEGPGQVLCHNVHLNGGLWWVVGPDGRRRA